MSNEAATHPLSLSQTVLKMIQYALSGGMTFDTITTVLSLLCLLSIVQHSQPAEAQIPAAAPAPSAAPPAGTADGLQKLLGQLMKSEGSGGGSGDALMSLLPLLNNPQIKSKMTPGNIAAILGLINNFSGAGDSKHEKSEKEKQDSKGDGKKDSPAATVTAGADAEIPEMAFSEPANPELITADSDALPAKDKTRYLEWKNNF